MACLKLMLQDGGSGSLLPQLVQFGAAVRNEALELYHRLQAKREVQALASKLAVQSEEDEDDGGREATIKLGTSRLVLPASVGRELVALHALREMLGLDDLLRERGWSAVQVRTVLALVAARMVEPLQNWTQE